MKRILLSSFLLLLLGTAVWWMCLDVVWLGDDLDYKYMMKGEIWQSWGRIDTIKGLFRSQWIHYQHVNGRYVSHFLVQLFNARLGQFVFAICNGIVYMLFAFLLTKAAKPGTFNNPGGILSAICISVLCFITKMMPTCQIGYIWAIAINIAWLMLFFRVSRPSWLLTALMLLGGVIAGNWQESISLGVCGALGIWWIIQLKSSFRYQPVRFDWRRSWMLLGYVAGTVSNCLAPSTLGRVGDIEMPLVDRLLIFSYSLPVVMILAICAVYLTSINRRIRLFSFSNEEGEIPTGVLTSGMLMLIIFNIAIGIYSNRQLFGANMFAAILLLRILPAHRFSPICNAMASFAVMAFWALMLLGMAEVHHQYEEIGRLHSQSPDGSVYFDRTRVMTLGFPLRAKYYEDILGQFDNDLHHSLMKDFKHIRKGKTLKLKPTAMMKEESSDCYAPGHFTVTLKEPPKGEAPREVIIYGHYPAGIKAAPRKIKVTRFSKRSKELSTAVIIPEFPFFTADSIGILPDN